MNKYLLYLLSVVLFLSASAWADTYQLNENAFFIRSTPQFGRSRSNIVGVITQDAKFELIRRVTRPDGSEAWEIHVIDPSENGNVNPSPSGTYWIYKSRGSDFSRLTSGGTPVTTQSEGECLECQRGNSSPIPNRDRDNIGDISREATRSDEVAPTPAPRAAPQRIPTPAAAPATAGPLNYDQSILNYSNSPRTQRTLQYARSHFGSRRRGRGGCYRAVKDSLSCDSSRQCLISSWYSGVPASGAVRDLSRAPNNFINLMTTSPYAGRVNARNAPKGAVLVYSSGVPCRHSRIPDCGHVEIKMGNPGEDGYISDFYFPDPINDTPRIRRNRGRTNYRLIGVMVKPM